MGFKRWKRALTAAATFGMSEQARFAMDKTKDLAGITAAEEANDEAKALAQKAQADALAAEGQASDEAYADIEKARRKRASMRGRSSTILTGSLGAPDSNVLRRTLLGA